MFALIGLLLVPLVIGGAMFGILRKTITWKEFLVMEAIPLVIVVVGFLLARMGAMSATEYWNGRVDKKIHDSQKCCHCRQVCQTCYRSVQRCSGSGKNRSCRSEQESYQCNCREVCDHWRDYYWAIHISTEDQVTIKRCEPNKSQVPQAWEDAYLGEPASVSKSYTNYLQADPDSLIHEEADPMLVGQVPPYPDIHSHYKRNHVIGHGLVVPAEWEKGLREINADFGSHKQVDVTLLVTKVENPEFAVAVQNKWLYGPKNSVTIVAGVKEGVFDWVRVISLSRVEELKIHLRDTLKGVALTDAEKGLGIIRKAINEKFTRTPMEEWEYLASAATPSTGWLIFLYVLAVLSSAGVGIWAHREDIFKEGQSTYVWGRRRSKS